MKLVYRALDLGQARPHGLQEPPGQRSGDHLIALTGKQRVIKVVPEPGQRVAHGRLGQVQRPGGAGQATLPVDGVENVQQVQVQAIQGHGQGPFFV